MAVFGKKGRKTKQDEHKIVLYADDVLLFLTNSSTSLPELIVFVNRFRSFPGYNINFGKSVELSIDRLRENKQNIQFQINRDGLKSLDIFVLDELKQLTKHNTLPVIAKIKNDLQRWSVLRLSIICRIALIKMNVLPRILYPITKCFRNLHRYLNSYGIKKKKTNI